MDRILQEALLALFLHHGPGGARAFGPPAFCGSRSERSKRHGDQADAGRSAPIHDAHGMGAGSSEAGARQDKTHQAKTGENRGELGRGTGFLQAATL